MTYREINDNISDIMTAVFNIQKLEERRKDQIEDYWADKSDEYYQLRQSRLVYPPDIELYLEDFDKAYKLDGRLKAIDIQIEDNNKNLVNLLHGDKTFADLLIALPHSIFVNAAIKRLAEEIPDTVIDSDDIYSLSALTVAETRHSIVRDNFSWDIPKEDWEDIFCDEDVEKYIIDHPELREKLYSLEEVNEVVVTIERDHWQKNVVQQDFNYLEEDLGL